MRSALAYTSARILLFVAAMGVLYALGARGLLLVALALLVSGIVSFIVLSRQRDAMSAAFTGRIHGFRSRLDAGARAEDDDSA
jgi:Mn2+/Fe2+ NRAMP family transporter